MPDDTSTNVVINPSDSLEKHGIFNLYNIA